MNSIEIKFGPVLDIVIDLIELDKIKDDSISINDISFEDQLDIGKFICSADYDWLSDFFDSVSKKTLFHYIAPSLFGDCELIQLKHDLVDYMQNPISDLLDEAYSYAKEEMQEEGF